MSAFGPPAPGLRSGALTVTDNGPDSPQVASLTGLGTQTATCVSNTLSDGGFESGTLTCWTAGGVFPPVISTQQAHGGSFSAQLGATGTPDTKRRLVALSNHHGPQQRNQPDFELLVLARGPADTIDYDWQEAQIRDSNGNKLAQIFKPASNSQTWTQVTFDLTPYKGQTIQIYFNAHEDGYGDLTYMYLDDVSLTIGGSPQPLQFVAGHALPPGGHARQRGGFGGRDSGRNFPRAFPYRKKGAVTFPSAQRPIR